MAARGKGSNITVKSEPRPAPDDGSGLAWRVQERLRGQGRRVMMASEQPRIFARNETRNILPVRESDLTDEEREEYRPFIKDGVLKAGDTYLAHVDEKEWKERKDREHIDKHEATEDLLDEQMRNIQQKHFGGRPLLRDDEVSAETDPSRTREIPTDPEEYARVLKELESE